MCYNTPGLRQIFFSKFGTGFCMRQERSGLFYIGGRKKTYHDGGGEPNTKKKKNRSLQFLQKGPN